MTGRPNAPLLSLSPLPSLSYLSSSLSVFHSVHTHSIPASPVPQTLPHLSIHPSSVLSYPARIQLASFSSSLFFFVCVYLPLNAAFVWGLSWNVLGDPVSNTGTRNIWHIFNSQGQLQLFIQRLRLNFPRFPLDLPQIAMCVCHILNQASFLSSPPATLHQIFQSTSSGFKACFYLWLSCAPSFFPFFLLPQHR